MPTLKYFDGIIAVQEADAAKPRGPLPPFDFESLGSSSRIKRWASRFVLRRLLPLIAAVLRIVWPNPRFGRFILVTRRRDVEQVLRRMDEFPVVYGPEMEELGDGVNNILGLDNAAHDRLHAILSAAITRDDAERLGETVARDARALIDGGAGRIDIFADLVTRTATEASCRLFGLDPSDRELFAHWTMAMSNQLFGDFFCDPNIRQQAQTAAAHLRAVIDAAIDRAERRVDRTEATAEDALENAPHHVIDRLIRDHAMPRGEIRATVLGLITAFMPTNTLAAGNIVEVLLERTALLDRARAAAIAGDRAALEAVLLDAGSMNPALSPGLWRHRPRDAAPTQIGDGSWGRRQVRPGDLLLACIPSALRDGSRRGDARERAWLMFGHGPHVCLGAGLALEHLTSVFMALLSQAELAPAAGQHGRMLRVGPFPVRMDMTYRHAGSRRAMIVGALPVREGTERKAVEAALDAVGNPVGDAIRATLAGVPLQFASLSVIERAPHSDASILLYELSGDGDDHALLDEVAQAGFTWLAPIFAHCSADGAPPASPEVLARMLRHGRAPLHFRPWGSTGLHFDGLPEMSVQDIARQEVLAQFSAAVVNDYVRGGVDLSARAMDILNRTRRLIRGDSTLLEMPGTARVSAPVPPPTTVLRPSRKRLSIADWQKPRSFREPLPRLLRSPSGRPLTLAMLVTWIVSVAGLALWLGPDRGVPWWEWIIALFPLALGGLVVAAAALALAFAGFMLLIRWCEAREPSDEGQAPLDHVEALARREDASGTAQNHIIAVMPFKPGLIRRLSFAFAMWGIAQTVSHWFRPGFVLTMGTIHKARWFRVPGTNQFAFFSNYDGSWESYLEDFITRAHEGQSAAWSHGVGFPRTRYLIVDGASDGDRFKQWVRRQQRETRLWYTRFPQLTAEQIRNNAMIEDGLARATSDSDARRWLSLFGSMQRPETELETQEIQSLVFSGFPRQHAATAIALRLPSDAPRASAWLSAVTGQKALPDNAFLGAPPEWLDEASGEIALPIDARVRFGETPATSGGTMLGLSSAGLERLGLTPENGLDTLPSVFRMTMARRGTLLGDREEDVANWRITDDFRRDDGAHAVLVVYGCEDGSDHTTLVRRHVQLMTHLGCAELTQVPCSPVEPGQLDVEHFGFRDGISQPVIRGTARASLDTPERDLVAAGEFVLGYPNGQGFTPPPFAVGVEHDVHADLPTVSASHFNRMPWFGRRPDEPEWRDFGRNGSFLAIRQLDQDVAGFAAGMQTIADTLNDPADQLPELVGSPISADWVAAKVIGRWRDGTPMVGHPWPPDPQRSTTSEKNDFSYGQDDPRGLACPLGAHIRRANPRNSREADDPDEQAITNRHRLLRRGRSYAYVPEGEGGETRKGLLFMALCADLERQFEFVQRSWLNATSFHGLVDEVDPLLGGSACKATRNGGGFTIPTAAGPVRVEGVESHVTTRGGGYFFLPSRSALRFLIRLGETKGAGKRDEPG